MGRPSVVRAPFRSRRAVVHLGLSASRPTIPRSRVRRLVLGPNIDAIDLRIESVCGMVPDNLTPHALKFSGFERG